MPRLQHAVLALLIVLRARSATVDSRCRLTVDARARSLRVETARAGNYSSASGDARSSASGDARSSASGDARFEAHLARAPLLCKVDGAGAGRVALLTLATDLQ